MSKIQEFKSKPRQNAVTIPQEVMREMGWQKGDIVTFKCNKRADFIVLCRKEKQEKHEG